jgi:hypothetical protein
MRMTKLALKLKRSSVQWRGYAAALFLGVLMFVLPIELHAKGLKETFDDLTYELYDLDPNLYDRIDQAEKEFRAVINQIQMDLITADVRLRMDGRDSDEGRLARASNQLWGRIFALPRALYLGPVRRAAINLVQERIVIFDLNLWESEGPQARKLLVLTELARFGGIEGEDDRYRFAARILTKIQTTMDHESMSDAVEMTMSLHGDPMLFDKDKIFLSFNFDGLDQTHVYLVNPNAEAIHGRLCQEPDKAKPTLDEKGGVVRRLYEGVVSFPDTVEYCRQAIIQRRPVRARVVFSALNLHMNVCAPQF